MRFQLMDPDYGGTCSAVNLTFLPSISPPPYAEYAQVIIQEGVKVAETAGGPAAIPIIKMYKQAGVFVIHKCPAIRHAQAAEKVGVGKRRGFRLAVRLDTHIGPPPARHALYRWVRMRRPPRRRRHPRTAAGMLHSFFVHSESKNPNLATPTSSLSPLANSRRRTSPPAVSETVAASLPPSPSVRRASTAVRSSWQRRSRMCMRTSSRRWSRRTSGARRISSGRCGSESCLRCHQRRS